MGMVVVVPVESKGPTDWSDWETYRGWVRHPAGAIKGEDLERARHNLQRYEWARTYLARLRQDADHAAAKITPAYLEHMIEHTTPGCTGPCPACRAKGLPWHPNGQWSWSPDKPDQLTCRVCKTVFPNEQFPETIVVRSTWDPTQTFTFVGGATFRCFGYHHARPSISGIIRARKLGYVTGRLSTLARAYALTGEGKYARAARLVFLRLAQVFPKYLVRAGYGYGEYTDCDPHVAAERIDDLPNDELVYPPNKPDRKLYAGYWAASRVGSSGMDGRWVCRVAEAYDLTCEARDGETPVFSAEERRRIEHDVLLESTYLAACDESINNKSVGNRAGCAMVGAVVGHPGLLHFGVDGFRRTVDGWFLPDGGTSESSAYAMMTMQGIAAYSRLLRDYSDPPGYRDAEGNRLDHFNACRDTRYGDCWQALIWTLQGNLYFPPSADSYRTSAIGPSSAELIALAYPTAEHLALLKEYAGNDLSGGSPADAILYRETGLDERPIPPLSLPDIVFPFLQQGYLRTGATGRDSLLLLDASHFGNHHHLDSLNLYYWKDGHELLSDLGYLWDHPDAYQTRRTFAHNLVMLDGADQRGRGRAGNFHLFSVTPFVKVMEASSRAYRAAAVYRRTCVQVDHGASGSYVLDVFRVNGGRRQQYVFHGPGNTFQVQGLDFNPVSETARPVRFAVRFHLPQVSEIFVDDVEIRRVRADGALGPNLAPNPSVTRDPPGKSAPGWKVYLGDGTADEVVVSPGRTDDRCLRFRALKPHANGRVNVALVCGDSNGYQGTHALEGVLGVTYRLTCWLKGNAPRVNLQAVTWPNDPANPGDRVHVPIGHLTASTEWKRFQATFTLPEGRLPLADIRQAAGAKPWSLVWTLPDHYRFAAFAPGNRREHITLGDGWGQRNHRNTDRGATLPYVVRERQGPALNTFVSVFCGAEGNPLPVSSVKLLDLPPGASPGTVAVEVTTMDGTDVILSALQPHMSTVHTSVGPVTTDGRVAVLLSSGRSPSAACLLGGTRLTTPACQLSSFPAREGRVVRTGSEAGNSWFVVEGEFPTGVEGSVFFAFDRDAGCWRAYPVRGLVPQGTQTKVFTKVDNLGFEARRAEKWRFVPTTWTGIGRPSSSRTGPRGARPR